MNNKQNGPRYHVDPEHTVALAQLTKHQERVAYACEHMPRADLQTTNVQAWLLVHGWKVPRPKVSQSLNEWRRANDPALVQVRPPTREDIRRILDALIVVADEHHEEFVAHLNLTDPAESIGETQ